MKTIEVFNEQQEKIVSTLKKLLTLLSKGEKFGIEISEEAIKKIENAIDENKNKKLKVALIGGFSEGKTSIAAAWLENYDKDKMKIAMSESTDDVREYEFENLHLVDTPGLFGFKKLENDQKFKDITEKYVSEANIILYVMNPDNPIKESHKETITWLFKKLNLLPRTIFILSKFDSVVDIEEENEYLEKLDIKRKNIQKRLSDFEIIKNIDNEINLPVVAVSANPFNEGIEYWLKNLNEFKKISRIDSLQNETTKLIKNNGGVDNILLETQKTIITDLISVQKPIVEEKIEKENLEVNKLNNTVEDLRDDLKKIESKINDARISLRKYINNLFPDLILQLEGTSLETFGEFFERNIGSEGKVLEENIEIKFSEELKEIGTEISQLERNFNNEIKNFETMTNDSSLNKYKFGADILKTSSPEITNAAIIGIRDFLNVAIKFKPWQAVKIANAINKGVPIAGAIIGIGIEAWDTYSKFKKEEKFEEAKKEFKNNFEKQRASYIDYLKNEEEFDKKVFKNYYELNNKISELTENLNEKINLKTEFEVWIKEVQEIEKVIV